MNRIDYQMHIIYSAIWWMLKGLWPGAVESIV